MTTQTKRALEALRALLEAGGGICCQCGKTDYAAHFLYRDGKPYCDDCAEEIGLTEENTE